MYYVTSWIYYCKFPPSLKLSVLGEKSTSIRHICNFRKHSWKAFSARFLPGLYHTECKATTHREGRLKVNQLAINDASAIFSHPRPIARRLSEQKELQINRNNTCVYHTSHDISQYKICYWNSYFSHDKFIASSIYS